MMRKECAIEKGGRKAPWIEIETRVYEPQISEAQKRIAIIYIYYFMEISSPFFPSSILPSSLSS